MNSSLLQKTSSTFKIPLILLATVGVYDCDRAKQQAQSLPETQVGPQQATNSQSQLMVGITDQ
ncbi:hypothetical protein AB6T38_02290 [Aliiglaciecola sp. SL4]|uniref:hypothetical protein n=1 Tax=Aliiglaciecola sp. SL4 TaxID=3239806 RepID=UPI00355BCA41